MEISKEQLIAAMGLAAKHSWLIKKSTELVELLFVECSTEEQRVMVHDLLDRFVYITQAELARYVSLLAEEIVTSPHLAPDNTIIAAMAADSSPDSSQYLVQMIKTKLQHLNWAGVEIVNTFGAAFKTSKKSNFAKLNIIILDEFIGSGKTAISRRDEIIRQFETAKQKPEIFFKVIGCSTVGIKKLAQEKANLSYLLEIKKGITDFEKSSETINHRISLMQVLETGLSKIFGTHKLEECTLGYGGTESLIALEEGNIPNSVFPIFWWPERSGGEIRKTLFNRWMGV